MIETNNPALRSFIAVDSDSHFPIQNLPFGVFRPSPAAAPRIGTAIGEYVLDLSILEKAGLLAGWAHEGEGVFSESSLNRLAAAAPSVWSDLRRRASRLLRHDEPALRDAQELRSKALLARSQVEMLLPVQIGDYTDFYSSRDHATNVGKMFRGADKALMPNWLHLPVAYHGRASSVVVSGKRVTRPQGQTKADDAQNPSFGPSRLLDFELEMGLLIGSGNALGTAIPLERSGEHIFGMVLVNDWSARDIQKWEYVPLGPFLGKSFATSISPWVVTLEALQPFAVDGPVQDPRPLPYLQQREPASFDIHLEVELRTPSLERGQVISRSNFRNLYWSVFQQVAHHTVNGCNLRTGDLLASGTISGATADSYGSMLELAWRGTRPLELSSGEQRSFLQDGDTVTMTGWCQGDGYRVGFGEVTGTVAAASSGQQ